MSNKPKVWLAVLPLDVVLGRDDEWKWVQEHIDGVKFWTQQVDDPAETWPFQGNVATPDAFKRIIEVLNKHNIPLIIEKGCWPQRKSTPGLDRMGGEAGPYDATLPKRAAANELARIEHVKSLGGTVSTFDVDGPERHLMFPVLGGIGVTNFEDAITMFVEYMRIIHKQHPKIDFYALSNFPNFGWKGGLAYYGTMNWGDYYTALEAIIRLSKKAKLPMKGVTVDNPYDYATGRVVVPFPEGYDPKSIDWMSRIRGIEDICHKNKLEFNLVVNSQTPGETNMRDYCKETLQYVDHYTKLGGRPDTWIVQSWYTHPLRDEVLPETKPNTFMWLVKQVIQKVKG
ncbi:MAG: hypothetical protein ACYC1M_17045 [Armatimonadota bacterium]